VTQPIPIGLPPAEAVAFFERKGRSLTQTFDWRDFHPRQHAGSFTVAKSAGFDVLGDIHAAMLAAIKEGRTFQQFAAELTPVLQKKGWWGLKEVVDPVTGEVRLAQLGSLRRLRTIFDTNMRMAYHAGRWMQIWRNRVLLPFLMYSAIDDERVRPLHWHWHGTVLPVEHEWWNTHYPPNGWHCRCTPKPVTRRQAERVGITQRAPSAPPRRWFNERTGEYEEVPAGIDPGFQYNVGKLAMELGPEEQAVTLHVEKAVGAPLPLGAARFAGMNAAEHQALDQAFAIWATHALDPKHRGRPRFVVGGLTVEQAAAMGAAGAPLLDATVSLYARDLRHLSPPTKVIGKALDDIDRRLISRHWRERFAILRTKQGYRADRRFVVVMPSPPGETGDRVRVVVVEVNARMKDRAVMPGTFGGNRIVTGGLVDRSTLRDVNNYELVWGSLS